MASSPSIGDGFGQPTVTVTGSAIVRTEPDEAVVWISLTALKDLPGSALADVGHRSTGLVALLDEVGVGKADRSTSGVTVYEEFEHGAAGRRSVGHHAVSRVSVRLTEPDLIGRLIERSTADLAAQIDGPHWLISPDNPARLKAARQAAADAQRTAQAYAEGVGAELGRLIRLAEPEHPRGLRTAAASAKHPAGDMPVEPGESEVTAAIAATFALNLG
ncbi:MAG: SIMPL domain-containing protein [Solirubrobacteraceae bacterium]